MESDFGNQLPSYHNNTYNGTLLYRVDDFPSVQSIGVAISNDNYLASLGQQVLILSDLDQAVNSQESSAFGSMPSLHNFKSSTNMAPTKRTMQIKSYEEVFSPWAEFKPKYIPLHPTAVLSNDQLERFGQNNTSAALTTLTTATTTTQTALDNNNNNNNIHNNDPNSLISLTPTQQLLLLQTPQVFHTNIIYRSTLKGVPTIGNPRKGFLFSMSEDPTDMTANPIHWFTNKAAPPGSKLLDFIHSTQTGLSTSNGYEHTTHHWWRFPFNNRYNQYMIHPRFKSIAWSPRGAFPSSTTTSLLAVVSTLANGAPITSVAVITPGGMNPSGDFSRAPLVSNVRSLLVDVIQTDWVRFNNLLALLESKAQLAEQQLQGLDHEISLCTLSQNNFLDQKVALQKEYDNSRTSHITNSSSKGRKSSRLSGVKTEMGLEEDDDEAEITARLHENMSKIDEELGAIQVYEEQVQLQLKTLRDSMSEMCYSIDLLRLRYAETVAIADKMTNVTNIAWSPAFPMTYSFYYFVDNDNNTPPNHYHSQPQNPTRPPRARTPVLIAGTVNVTILSLTDSAGYTHCFIFPLNFSKPSTPPIPTSISTTSAVKPTPHSNPNTTTLAPNLQHTSTIISSTTPSLSSSSSSSSTPPQSNLIIPQSTTSNTLHNCPEYILIKIASQLDMEITNYNHDLIPFYYALNLQYKKRQLADISAISHTHQSLLLDLLAFSPIVQSLKKITLNEQDEWVNRGIDNQMKMKNFPTLNQQQVEKYSYNELVDIHEWMEGEMIKNGVLERFSLTPEKISLPITHFLHTLQPSDLKLIVETEQFSGQVPAIKRDTQFYSTNPDESNDDQIEIINKYEPFASNSSPIDQSLPTPHQYLCSAPTPKVKHRRPHPAHSATHFSSLLSPFPFYYGTIANNRPWSTPESTIQPQSAQTVLTTTPLLSNVLDQMFMDNIITLKDHYTGVMRKLQPLYFDFYQKGHPQSENNDRNSEPNNKHSQDIFSSTTTTLAPSTTHSRRLSNALINENQDSVHTNPIHSLAPPRLILATDILKEYREAGQPGLKSSLIRLTPDQAPPTYTILPSQQNTPSIAPWILPFGKTVGLNKTQIHLAHYRTSVQWQWLQRELLLHRPCPRSVLPLPSALLPRATVASFCPQPLAILPYKVQNTSLSDFSRLIRGLWYCNTYPKVQIDDNDPNMTEKLQHTAAMAAQVYQTNPLCYLNQQNQSSTPYNAQVRRILAELDDLGNVDVNQHLINLNSPPLNTTLMVAIGTSDGLCHLQRLMFPHIAEFDVEGYLLEEFENEVYESNQTTSSQNTKPLELFQSPTTILTTLFHLVPVDTNSIQRQFPTAFRPYRIDHCSGLINPLTPFTEDLRPTLTPHGQNPESPYNELKMIQWAPFTHNPKQNPAWKNFYNTNTSSSISKPANNSYNNTSSQFSQRSQQDGQLLTADLLSSAESGLTIENLQFDLKVPDCQPYPTHIAYNLITITKTNKIYPFTLQPFLLTRQDHPPNAQSSQNSSMKSIGGQRYRILPNLAFNLSPMACDYTHRDQLHQFTNTTVTFDAIPTKHYQGIASCIYIPGYCPLMSLSPYLGIEQAQIESSSDLNQTITNFDISDNHNKSQLHHFNSTNFGSINPSSSPLTATSFLENRLDTVNTYTSPNSYSDLYHHSLAMFSYSRLSSLPAFITPIGAIVLSGLEGGTSLIKLNRKVIGGKILSNKNQMAPANLLKFNQLGRNSFTTSVVCSKPDYFFSVDQIQTEYYQSQLQQGLSGTALAQYIQQDTIPLGQSQSSSSTTTPAKQTALQSRRSKSTAVPDDNVNKPQVSKTEPLYTFSIPPRSTIHLQQRSNLPLYLALGADGLSIFTHRQLLLTYDEFFHTATYSTKPSTTTNEPLPSWGSMARHDSTDNLVEKHEFWKFFILNGFRPSNIPQLSQNSLTPSASSMNDDDNNKNQQMWLTLHDDNQNQSQNDATQHSIDVSLIPNMDHFSYDDLFIEQVQDVTKYHTKLDPDQGKRQQSSTSSDPSASHFTNLSLNEVGYPRRSLLVPYSALSHVEQSRIASKFERDPQFIPSRPLFEHKVQSATGFTATIAGNTLKITHMNQVYSLPLEALASVDMIDQMSVLSLFDMGLQDEILMNLSSEKYSRQVCGKLDSILHSHIGNFLYRSTMEELMDEHMVIMEDNGNHTISDSASLSKSFPFCLPISPPPQLFTDKQYHQLKLHLAQYKAMLSPDLYHLYQLFIDDLLSLYRVNLFTPAFSSTLNSPDVSLVTAKIDGQLDGLEKQVEKILFDHNDQQLSQIIPISMNFDRVTTLQLPIIDTTTLSDHTKQVTCLMFPTTSSITFINHRVSSQGAATTGSTLTTFTKPRHSPIALFKQLNWLFSIRHSHYCMFLSTIHLLFTDPTSHQSKMNNDPTPPVTLAPPRPSVAKATPAKAKTSTPRKRGGSRAGDRDSDNDHANDDSHPRIKQDLSIPVKAEQNSQFDIVDDDNDNLSRRRPRRQSTINRPIFRDPSTSEDDEISPKSKKISNGDDEDEDMVPVRPGFAAPSRAPARRPSKEPLSQRSSLGSKSKKGKPDESSSSFDEMSDQSSSTDDDDSSDLDHESDDQSDADGSKPGDDLDFDTPDTAKSRRSTTTPKPKRSKKQPQIPSGLSTEDLENERIANSFTTTGQKTKRFDTVTCICCDPSQYYQADDDSDDDHNGANPYNCQTCDSLLRNYQVKTWLGFPYMFSAPLCYINMDTFIATNSSCLQSFVSQYYPNKDKNNTKFPVELTDLDFLQTPIVPTIARTLTTSSIETASFYSINKVILLTYNMAVFSLPALSSIFSPYPSLSPTPAHHVVPSDTVLSSPSTHQPTFDHYPLYRCITDLNTSLFSPQSQKKQQAVDQSLLTSLLVTNPFHLSITRTILTHLNTMYHYGVYTSSRIDNNMVFNRNRGLRLLETSMGQNTTTQQRNKDLAHAQQAAFQLPTTLPTQLTPLIVQQMDGGSVDQVQQMIAEIDSEQGTGGNRTHQQYQQPFVLNSRNTNADGYDITAKKQFDSLIGFIGRDVLLAQQFPIDSLDVLKDIIPPYKTPKSSQAVNSKSNSRSPGSRKTLMNDNDGDDDGDNDGDDDANINTHNKRNNQSTQTAFVATNSSNQPWLLRGDHLLLNSAFTALLPLFRSAEWQYAPVSSYNDNANDDNHNNAPLYDHFVVKLMIGTHSNPLSTTPDSKLNNSAIHSTSLVKNDPISAMHTSLQTTFQILIRAYTQSITTVVQTLKQMGMFYVVSRWLLPQWIKKNISSTGNGVSVASTTSNRTNAAIFSTLVSILGDIFVVNHLKMTQNVVYHQDITYTSALPQTQAPQLRQLEESMRILDKSSNSSSENKPPSSSSPASPISILCHVLPLLSSSARLTFHTLSLAQSAQAHTLALRSNPQHTTPSQNDQHQAPNAKPLPLLREYESLLPISPPLAFFTPFSTKTTLPILRSAAPTSQIPTQADHIYAVPSPLVQLKTRNELLTQSSQLFLLHTLPTLFVNTIPQLYLYCSLLLQGTMAPRGPSTSQNNSSVSEHSMSDSATTTNTNTSPDFSSRSAILIENARISPITQAMVYIPDTYFINNLLFSTKVAFSLSHFFNIPLSYQRTSLLNTNKTRRLLNSAIVNQLNPYLWQFLGLVNVSLVNQQLSVAKTQHAINLLRGGFAGLRALIPMRSYCNELTISTVQETPYFLPTEQKMINFGEPFNGFNYQDLADFLSNPPPIQQIENQQQQPQFANPHQPMTFVRCSKDPNQPSLLYSITTHIASSARGLDLFNLAPSDMLSGVMDKDQQETENYQSRHLPTAFRLGSAARDVNGLIVHTQPFTTQSFFNNTNNTQTSIPAFQKTPFDYDNVTIDHQSIPPFTNLAYPQFQLHQQCQLCHGVIPTVNTITFEPVLNRYRNISGLIQTYQQNDSIMGRITTTTATKDILDISASISPSATCWSCCARPR